MAGLIYSLQERCESRALKKTKTTHRPHTVCHCASFVSTEVERSVQLILRFHLFLCSHVFVDTGRRININSDITTDQTEINRI